MILSYVVPYITQNLSRLVYDFSVLLLTVDIWSSLCITINFWTPRNVFRMALPPYNVPIACFPYTPRKLCFWAGILFSRCPTF